LKSLLSVKAQKLCDRLIQTHSNEDDVVFIPFVGSGSEIISAIKNKRKVIGCESSKNYIELSVNRIENFTGVRLNAMATN
jgi:site-specific DNA-methyltransferase (adenine-specific)